MPHEECPHLQISTNRAYNEKPSCIDCGLVQEPEGNPYIRNISHYKELYSIARGSPEDCPSHVVSTFRLLGDNLKEQAIKFRLRQEQPKKTTSQRLANASVKIVKDLETDRQTIAQELLATEGSPRGLHKVEQGWFLYFEYIDFLRNNTDRVLPKKDRKRPICQIYGDHRRIVLFYIWCLEHECPVGSVGSSPLVGSP